MNIGDTYPNYVINNYFRICWLGFAGQWCLLSQKTIWICLGRPGCRVRVGLSDRFRYADTVPGYAAGLSFRHRQCAPVRAKLSSDRFIYSDNVPRYVPGYIQTPMVYSGMCLDSHWQIYKFRLSDCRQKCFAGQQKLEVIIAGHLRHSCFWTVLK